MSSKERGFRPKQKGVECSVEGCTDWCISNDMCPRHNMAVWRRTEKGKASVKRFNDKRRRDSITKECRHCGGEFVTARKAQGLCSACSKSHGSRYSRERRKEIKNG